MTKLKFGFQIKPYEMNNAEKPFYLKNTQQESRLFSNRAVLAWLFMLLMLSVIASRLLYLQVFEHQRYTTLSENNRIKVLPLAPTRGLIYDRNGVILAENRPSHSLMIIAEQVKDMDALLAQLGELVQLDEADLERFAEQRKRRRRFEHLPLRLRLNDMELARVAVKSATLDGVEVVSNLSRYYPLGQTGVHVIGYVGRINETELQHINANNYRGSHYIGKTGIEKSYETVLHGLSGNQSVEVNVKGRVLRVVKRNPPQPGKNLYLNIDIALQRYAEALVEGERASIVAIEPSSGGVLALVSTPTYDPNLFVHGISHADYNALNTSLDRPLYNRALRGQYPPGSTVKPFFGLAGLDYGLRQPNQSTYCRGGYSLPGHSHQYRDWKRAGHGWISLEQAIAQSCDVYFYDLAHELEIDRMHTFMNRFSFGRKTGIDIVGELSGLMPSREWKRRTRGQPWFPGETLIAGIGQGFMLATPLQLAFATATLANRGQVHQPRVAFALDDPNSGGMQVVSAQRLPAIVLKDKSYWQNVINGMEAVIYGRRGTARQIGVDAPYRLVGKTGTAQVFGIKKDEKYDEDKLAKRLHDHSWFIAFAPLDAPKIAVAVVVENGGGGSRIAAPLARKIMDFHLLPQQREALWTDIKAAAETDAE